MFIYSVHFLIYQDRKFILQQSLLSTVHSGSEKQMYVYYYFWGKEQQVPFSVSFLMSQTRVKDLFCIRGIRERWQLMQQKVSLWEKKPDEFIDLLIQLCVLVIYFFGIAIKMLFYCQPQWQIVISGIHEMQKCQVFKDNYQKIKCVFLCSEYTI